MAMRKVPLIAGEYFHVYNRGNSKQIIFRDDHDRDRFIKLLYLCNSKKGVNFRDDIVRPKLSAWDFDRGETIVSIGAWVLMPNHFHLYITTAKSAEALLLQELLISQYMQKVLTAYSKYFNAKYGRTGRLFEDKFKAVHVGDDNQAKYLFSYIHLNPIKLIDPRWKEDGIKNIKQALNFLKQYTWSSYQDFKGVAREESKILDKENFLDYFPTVDSFDDEILDWLNYQEEI